MLQNRLEQTEFPDNEEQNHSQHKAYHPAHRPREASHQATYEHERRRAKPQHRNRALLAQPCAHETMMDMPQIGVFHRLMQTLASDDSRDGIEHGNSRDNERHQHDHKALRPNDAHHRHDADDQPEQQR